MLAIRVGIMNCCVGSILPDCVLDCDLWMFWVRWLLHEIRLGLILIGSKLLCFFVVMRLLQVVRSMLLAFLCVCLACVCRFLCLCDSVCGCECDSGVFVTGSLCCD